MTDLEGLDDDLAQNALVLVTPKQATVVAEALADAAEAMVRGLTANRIRMTDPQQRADLVELREELNAAIEPLTLARDTIDRVFLIFAVESKAREVAIPGGPAVHYEAARGQYVVQAPELRARLLELSLLDGAPTREEVDEALPEERVVSVKANNTHLNALVKRYGGNVAEAVAQMRQFVMPHPHKGRVRFPERSNRQVTR
jgi:hypothetical protein